MNSQQRAGYMLVVKMLSILAFLLIVWCLATFGFTENPEPVKIDPTILRLNDKGDMLVSDPQGRIRKEEGLARRIWRDYNYPPVVDRRSQ